MRPGAFAAALLVAGALCAADRPEWVEKNGANAAAYPAASFVTGFGISGSAGEEADKRDAALAMARRELISAIRVKVTSAFVDQSVEHNRALSQLAISLVKTESQMELEGLDRYEYFYDRKKAVYYVLAILEKERAANSLKEKIRALSARSEALFKNAQAAGDAAAMLEVKRLVRRIEEDLAILGILAGSSPRDIPYPHPDSVSRELRRLFAAEKGVDGYVGRAAYDLGSALPEGVRVLIDSIHFADTKFSGTFSCYVEDGLSEKLAKLGNAAIIDKRGLKDILAKEGLDKSAAALDPQVIVYGNYFDLGEGVKLSLRATSSTGEELSTAEVKLPKADIAQAGLKLLPDNYEEAKKALEIYGARVKDSQLQVKLSVDRGEGGVYGGGERLFVFLKANMDCHVKLVYHQADGSRVRIFPNRFHPGSQIEKDTLYQIPPDMSDFNFEIGPPFGVEVLKLFASTVPFEEDEGDLMGPGFRALSGDMTSMVMKTRGIAVRQKEAMYAEDMVVITTVDHRPAGASERRHRQE